MTDSQACYVMHVPTWSERLWRKLGYHHHHGDDPQDDSKFTGWMQNRSRFHFGFADRLRLLLTGELLVTTTFHLDTPSPDKLHTRLDWQIRAPGEIV